MLHTKQGFSIESLFQRIISKVTDETNDLTENYTEGNRKDEKFIL